MSSDISEIASIDSRVRRNGSLYLLKFFLKYGCERVFLLL